MMIGWTVAFVLMAAIPTVAIVFQIRRTIGAEFQTTANRCVLPVEAPQFQAGMTRPVRFLQDGERLRVELV